MTADSESMPTVRNGSRFLKKIWESGLGGKGSPQILKVKINGVLCDQLNDVFGEEKTSALAALKKIRAATRDDEIRGLYLVIDTPGGEVTLSDVLADAVQRFKKSKKDRFVLVEMGACCCSGGYYIAAGADHIMAHPTTITGSIGVIMETMNAAELAKKIGVESVVIATGTNKSMLDPLKPVDEEHVRILKKAVEADYDRFLEIVSKGRGIPLPVLRTIADGRIFSAREAKEIKLVDAIGYSEDAENMLVKMSKAEKIKIVRYEDTFTFQDLFNGTFFSIEGMGRVLRSFSEPRSRLKLNFIAE